MSDCTVGAEGPIVTTTDGMNLLFKVKYVFSHYVAEAPEYKEMLPDYPKYGETTIAPLYIVISVFVSRDQAVPSIGDALV